jgi:hypothetical protein
MVVDGCRLTHGDSQRHLKESVGLNQEDMKFDAKLWQDQKAKLRQESSS